jgi:hypothetical protein
MAALMAVTVTSQLRMRDQSSREAPGMTAREALESGAYETEFPNLSMGELIDTSDAVVIATVLGVSEPRWNSEDGADWSDLFNADPSKYDTPPLITTATSLHLERVVAQREATPSPALHAGDVIEVVFPEDPALDILTPETAAELSGLSRIPFLAPGDLRVLFLEWRSYPSPTGDGKLMWRGILTQGIWGITNSLDVVYPPAPEHQESLKSGYEEGAIEIVSVSEGVVGVPTLVFEWLIREEWATAKTTVASYSDWPA